MARAEIMARLGLDRSEFKRGLDGATSEAQGFEHSLRGIRSAMSLAFAVVGVRRFIDAVRELRQQAGDGVKIIDDGQLDVLGRTASKLEAIAAAAKGFGFSFFAT